MPATAVRSERSSAGHDKSVREVADSYRRRGYSVTIEPAADKLPKFLDGFSPDILATSSDESIIVEIKQSGIRDPARWRALAELVQQQPGWRFDIYVPDPDSLERLHSLSQAEIWDRLESAHRLMESGMLDAAYITAWSAAEAALRILKDREGIEVPDPQPGTLIARLYTDGDLNRRDYDHLMKALQLRNAVAHGYQSKLVSKDIVYLENLVHKILP